jgi:plastocyanin
MLFKQLAIASLLALAVNAQAPAPTGAAPAPTGAAPAPTGAAPAPGAGKVITIMVGQGGTTFTPNNVTAAIGDTVTFKWAPATGNHTVTQSTRDALCTRKDPVATSFASGVKAGAQNPVFSVKVNDTNPIWFYCAVLTHCVKGGMFGVINGPPGFAFKVPTAPATPSGGGAAGGDASGTPAAADASKPSGTSSASSLSSLSKTAVFAGAIAVAAFLL